MAVHQVKIEPGTFRSPVQPTTITQSSHTKNTISSGKTCLESTTCETNIDIVVIKDNLDVAVLQRTSCMQNNGNVLIRLTPAYN